MHFQISLKYIKLVIPKIRIILVLCSLNFYFKIGAAKTTVQYFAAGDFLEMI